MFGLLTLYILTLDTLQLGPLFINYLISTISHEKTQLILK